MSGTFQTDQASHRTRSRAKKACRNCNARRVRCNVVESQPCNNCARADVPCEIMSSRRGKYDRSSRSLHRVQNPPVRPEDHAAAQPSSEGQLENPVEDAMEDTIDDTVENRSGYTQAFMNIGDQLPHNVPNISHSAHHNSISPNASNPAHDSTDSSTTPKNGLESTVFLGESNSITTFSNPNRLATSDHRGLQYSIPGTVSANTVTPQETQRRANKIETLTKDGSFSVPPRESCETLFRAYFAWFHPCFPILERIDFYNSYIQKTLSPLLLQAVLFVAASYCDQKTLKDIGLSDRYDTRSTFYNRAKDIYDADYETNKIAVSQALFLMSFWRAGPLLEKDTRHWLGAAISLAQTKGMHRSSSKTSFSNAKLRKRIWWSLYVRDRQCSASLGLPIRIRDEDCDIEMLEEVDFDDDEDTTYHPDFLGFQTHEHVSYAIQMAKLARLLGKVVLREFAPGSITSEDLGHSKLRNELVTWEEALSPAMRSNATAESFWAAMLHLAYNNLYILLYRSAYVASLDGGQMALQAACKNTRILEDLLAQDLVRNGNVHLITSLFSSLCIHTLHLRRSTSSTVKKLAEYRAQLCLLGLRELQNTWDVTNWVLQLYFEFLDQSIAKRLQPIQGEDAPVVPRNSTVISQQHPSNVQEFEARPAGTPSSRSVEQAFDNPEWSADRQTMQSRHLVGSLDFATHLFSSREAEDFSMFQLQPDLFAGDMFGGGLDHYYNSMMPRAGGSVEPELRPA